ncbi:hypothetical protein Q5692_34550 [Microcoleus sp. C2C3]|uniref:hypothetical protein n=1 Tax=unclassified Microcoleus TaxID=2642155 RepID=UPI002FCFE683
MNKKFLVYSLVGLLSSGAITGFVLINSEQVQSLPAPGILNNLDRFESISILSK